jgi:phage gpG-like protein
MSDPNDIARKITEATQSVLRSPRFLKNVEEIVRTSIDLNFSEGGRFGNGIFGGGSDKWESSFRSRKQSGKPLSDTGDLAKQTIASVKATNTNNGLTISMGAKLPQAAIHNFGGKIPITDKSRGFFFFKTKTDSKNRKTWLALAMYAQRNEFFKVQARPYLVLQNDDVDDIISVFNDMFKSEFSKL